MADPFETFFTDYARAFDTSNAERIAAAYAIPCTFVNRNFSVSFDSVDAVLRNVDEILRYHSSEGVARSSVSDLRVEKLADNLAIVSVLWRVFRADNSLLWEWTNSYNLVDFGEGWRILVSTTHDAV